MKAINYAKRIRKNQSTSVHEVELLSKAMHREKLLSEKFELSFMPLYGTLRFVNSDYFLTGNLTFEEKVTIDDVIWRIENIEKLL